MHTAVLSGVDWEGIKLLGQDIRDSTIGKRFSAFLSRYLSPNSITTAQIPCVSIQYSDIIRWQLALEYGPDLSSRLPTDVFTNRVGNLPRFRDYDKYLTPFIGFAIVGFIYGGLHCVAWNAPFTTNIERILWRISSIAIAGTGILVASLFSWTKFPPFWQDPVSVFEDMVELTKDVLGNRYIVYIVSCTGYKWLGNLWGGIVAFLCNQISRFRGKVHRCILVSGDTQFLKYMLVLPFEAWDVFLVYSISVLLYLFKVLFDISLIPLAVLYVLARAYLVGISFYNLVHLPDSAYQLPQWSRYVPHIG